MGFNRWCSKWQWLISGFRRKWYKLFYWDTWQKITFFSNIQWDFKNNNQNQFYLKLFPFHFFVGNFMDGRIHNEDVQCRILYLIKLFFKKIFQGLARKSYNFSLPLSGGFQRQFQILTTGRKASRKKILILIISYTQFTPSPVYSHCKHL